MTEIRLEQLGSAYLVTMTHRAKGHKPRRLATFRAPTLARAEHIIHHLAALATEPPVVTRG